MIASPSARCRAAWALLCLCIALHPALAAAARAPAEAVLAENGRARMPVVVAANASAATRQVAAELASFLGRISEATFEVTTGDGAAGIVLGTIAEFPDAALAAPLENRDTYDGREAFVIRSEPGRVRLIGATDLGASHAAFRFLELLGCRWFFPAPEWEVIPRYRTLAITADEASRPALLSRKIWYAWGCFAEKVENGVTCQQSYADWARRNRMADSFPAQLNHAWSHISRDKVFVEHPEYLALVKGERKRPQLCVSNPAVREIVAQHALDHFAKNPASDIASVGPGDGFGFCECESCAKLGSVSDQVFSLVNEVARKVAAKHPGKMVGCLAYSLYSPPPSFPLEPNVYVQLTTSYLTGKYTFDELVDLWVKKCRRFGLYDYYSIWIQQRDMPPGGRGADLTALCKQVPRFATSGAQVLNCESGNNWGPNGLGYYVANRLMWDPTLDADALVADFHDRAFGPAAAVMKRYYERFDRGRQPMMGEPLLASALRDLDQAGALVRDRPDVLARLDHLKQYLHYVRLMWEFEQLGSGRDKRPDEEKQKAVELLRHAYRTRHSYMTHWEAMRNFWANQLAKKFAEPSWSSTNGQPKPWQDAATRPTAEETEADFRADLARFPEQPVEERAFGGDLVPSGMKRAKEAPLATKFDIGGKATLALYSRTGEPLAFTVTTGIIAKYRDRPDAEYVLRDGRGDVVQTGRLPQDGEEHALRLEVPQAGLYRLEFNDRGVGWKFRGESSLPCSLELARNPPYDHMGNISRVFFYVPKGTRTIHYFTRYGDSQKVFDPDEKPVHEVVRNGVNVSVEVPQGADGKIWHLGNVHLPTVWFHNLPNHVSCSPESLLVPKEALHEPSVPSK